jgi:hypothetical protein
VLRYPWSYPYEAPQSIDGGKHQTLHGEFLNAVQQCFPIG